MHIDIQINRKDGPRHKERGSGVDACDRLDVGRVVEFEYACECECYERDGEHAQCK